MLWPKKQTYSLLLTLLSAWGSGSCDFFLQNRLRTFISLGRSVITLLDFRAPAQRANQHKSILSLPRRKMLNPPWTDTTLQTLLWCCKRVCEKLKQAAIHGSLHCTQICITIGVIRLYDSDCVRGQLKSCAPLVETSYLLHRVHGKMSWPRSENDSSEESDGGKGCFERRMRRGLKEKEKLRKF